MAEKTKPANKIRVGRVVVTIWQNETDSGTRYNITLKRPYQKEGSDTWHDSDTFSIGDLLSGAKALDLAHTWLIEQMS